mgnify:CR=1 FL=1
MGCRPVFALALEAFPNNILEIDETENLSAWTLLLDEEDRKSAATQFDHFLYLIDILQGELPAQCAPLKAPHSFCYQTNKSGRPLEIDETENLSAWTLLLDEEDRKKRRHSVRPFFVSESTYFRENCPLSVLH